MRRSFSQEFETQTEWIFFYQSYGEMKKSTTSGKNKEDYRNENGSAPDRKKNTMYIFHSGNGSVS